MKIISQLLGLFLLLINISQVNAACWNYAGEKYQIEPRLLRSIAQVESGMNPQAIGHNTNGTYDIGIMQINSSHLKRLEKMGVTEDKLLEDPCVSVLVGASILKEMMALYGYSWEAVGAYNAGNCKTCHALRMKYAEKVWRVYLHNN